MNDALERKNYCYGIKIIQWTVKCLQYWHIKTHNGHQVNREQVK